MLIKQRSKGRFKKFRILKLLLIWETVQIDWFWTAAFLLNTMLTDVVCVFRFSCEGAKLMILEKHSCYLSICFSFISGTQQLREYPMLLALGQTAKLIWQGNIAVFICLILERMKKAMSGDVLLIMSWCVQKEHQRNMATNRLLNVSAPGTVA